MSNPLPTKAGKATVIKVEFSDLELAELKAWVAALPDPRPDVEQAVRMIVRNRIQKLSPSINVDHRR